MKKSLAIAWLCLLCFPVFGQATYSGMMAHQGTLSYEVSSGGPLTYAARTDNCETDRNRVVSRERMSGNRAQPRVTWGDRRTHYRRWVACRAPATVQRIVSVTGTS